MKKTRSTLILLLTAIIWGCAFVAQRVSSQYIGSFTFNAIRSALGAISLIPVILICERKLSREKRLASMKYSVVAGAILFVATNLQQFGINITQNAGKSAFITGLYTILVPIAYFVIFRRRTGINVVIGALTALVGLYLLCGSMGPLGIGDAYLFIGTLFWTAHIMWIDHSMALGLGAVTFSATQFAVAAILGAVAACFTETVTFDAIGGALVPILYAGIMSTGVAYTCQVIGQKEADPTLAAIVLSTESVWAAISGALMLDERMSVAAVTGCTLMLAGIIVAQVNFKRRKR